VAGHSTPIAQWLAMNVVPRSEGFALRLDLPAIRVMLEDYFARDLWSVAQDPRCRGRSRSWSPTDPMRSRPRTAHVWWARRCTCITTMLSALDWARREDRSIELLERSLLVPAQRPLVVLGDLEHEMIEPVDARELVQLFEHERADPAAVPLRVDGELVDEQRALAAFGVGATPVAALRKTNWSRP
jgi:hypothetical protein